MEEIESSPAKLAHAAKALTTLPLRMKLLRASEVGPAVADVIAGRINRDDDRAVGVGGAAGIGVVSEEILGAEFAVDAVEDGAEFLGRVGIEHGAAGRVGHGFEGMLTGGVAATFVLHRTDDDSVKKSAGEYRFFARRVEVCAAGGFARVGDQDDDAAAVIAAALERARTQKHGIINRSASAGGHLANRRLQLGDVIRKGCELRHIFIERENGEAIARPQHLADKVGGGFLLEANLLMGAQAGVDHDRQVQRLQSFRLELVDLLLDTFFKQLESLSGKVRRGAVLVVKDADKNVNEIDVDADAAALCGRILRIIREGGRRGLDDFSRLAVWRGGGSRGRGGSRT